MQKKFKETEDILNQKGNKKKIHEMTELINFYSEMSLTDHPNLQNLIQYIQKIEIIKEQCLMWNEDHKDTQFTIFQEKLRVLQ